jgi:hypothetical protein
MSREAMQIALDALEANLGNWAAKTKAVEVLRQALETDLARVGEVGVWGECEWVGLTDEEIHDLSYLSQKIDEGNAAWFDRWGFARAIEAKLKEKNKL